MRSILVLAALVLSTAVNAAATPEETVREYMTAVQARGLSVVSEYLHPAELDRFKEMLMPVFRKDSQSAAGKSIRMFFPAETTLADLQAMSPADFTSRLVVGVEKLMQDFKIEFSTLEVLGSVAEGENRHVVTRIGVDGPKGIKVKTMEVISTTPEGKGWKLLLTGELQGLAAALSGG